MKKYLFLILSAILFSVNTINAKTPEYDFENMYVNIPSKIVVLEGDTCSICIRASKDVAKYIDMTIVDNTLKVTSKFEDLLQDKNIKIIITTKKNINIEAGRYYNLIDTTKKNNDIDGEMMA